MLGFPKKMLKKLMILAFSSPLTYTTKQAIQKIYAFSPNNMCTYFLGIVHKKTSPGILHLITYSHNLFCSVPHLTFHYTEAKTTLCNRKRHLEPQARQSAPPQVSPFFSLDFYFVFVMVIPWHGRAGARETQIMQNHAKSHTCCTFIAPQAVLHLQLLRHKILSHLALQAKYRQFTQPHWHHTTVYPLSPTGVIQTVYSAPQAFWKYVYLAPQASYKYEYSAPQALCKRCTQPHRHCANSILSPTGIMQTVYSAPQALNIMLCPTGKTASHPTGVIHNKNISASYPKWATGYCYSNWRCHEIKRKNYCIKKEYVIITLLDPNDY